MLRVRSPCRAAIKPGTFLSLVVMCNCTYGTVSPRVPVNSIESLRELHAGIRRRYTAAVLKNATADRALLEPEIAVRYAYKRVTPRGRYIKRDSPLFILRRGCARHRRSKLWNIGLRRAGNWREKERGGGGGGRGEDIKILCRLGKSARTPTPLNS